MLNEKRDMSELLPTMYMGEELKKRLEILPAYHDGIRLKDRSERLMALNDIYSIYLPSVMSEEIYSKIYLAMLRSLNKKEGKLAVRQRNENGNRIRDAGNMGYGYQGIIGGSDSFTIIGNSGIGKSSAISRAVSLAAGNGIIELEEPYCRIIPAVVVQCPFDCSVKGLMLQLLRQVDMELDTHYYEMALRSRATTDMLIGSVSQTALNHIGLLVVDEIQNVVNHRQGKSLVGMLTQLINNSGISICMVGTPEAEVFFESVNYLARRALGLRYTKCEYNDYFMDFCTTIFQYQYVQKESVISDSIIQWLYEHSAGVIATVVSLMHDAQEISILSGKEELNMETLDLAYEQRMNMMHSHIQPSAVIRKDAIKRKKGKGSLQAAGLSQPVGRNVMPEKEKGGLVSDAEPATHPADRSGSGTWTFTELAEQAKRNQCDMLGLLKGRISITEITV